MCAWKESQRHCSKSVEEARGVRGERATDEMLPGQKRGTHGIERYGCVKDSMSGCGG